MQNPSRTIERESWHSIQAKLVPSNRTPNFVPRSLCRAAHDTAIQDASDHQDRSQFLFASRALNERRLMTSLS
jgi:hypothetical protein